MRALNNVVVVLAAILVVFGSVACDIVSSPVSPSAQIGLPSVKDRPDPPKPKKCPPGAKYVCD